MFIILAGGANASGGTMRAMDNEAINNGAMNNGTINNGDNEQ
jgi:hypothetical protein